MVDRNRIWILVYFKKMKAHTCEQRKRKEKDIYYFSSSRDIACLIIFSKIVVWTSNVKYAFKCSKLSYKIEIQYQWVIVVVIAKLIFVNGFET